jgi:putative flippase GtrA
VKALAQLLKDSVFARFFVVGAIGFLTDGGILQAEIWRWHVPPLLARLPSFAVAILVTWRLNRDFTFHTPEKSFRESFPIYLASNGAGLAINFAVYTGCVMTHVAPFLALAIASVTAMFFNFAMARFVVFRKKE